MSFYSEASPSARVTWELPILDLLSVFLAVLSIGVTLFLAFRVHSLHAHVESLSALSAESRAPVFLCCPAPSAQLWKSKAFVT